MKFNFKRTATSVGTLILLVYAFIALTTTSSLHTASQDNQIRKVEENINAHKQYLHGLIERAFVESRILNLTTSRLKSSGASTRATINDFLKSNLENNPEFLGMWMVWEPNAFDGEDEDHIGELGSDDSGRFVPYWYWKEDSVVLVRCLYFDESDYYLLPKKYGKSYLLEPYTYPIDGVDSVLVSVVIPIMIDGQFQGVVGVDIRQNELEKLVSNLADISGGKATLLSGNNTLVVSSAGNLDAQKKENDLTFLTSLKPKEILVDNVQAGSFESINFRFGSVLNIEESQGPWKLILEIPKPVLNGDFMSVRHNLLLLSGVSALFILLLSAYNVSQSKQLISEKTVVENRLFEADARLNSYMEGSSQSAIFSVDKNFNYTGFNSTHRNMMKLSFDCDIEIGDHMPSIIPEDLSSRLTESFQRAMKGEVFQYTSLFQEIYYTQSFNPIFDQSHQVIGVSSCVTDVTEHIQAEQQLEEYRDNLEKLVSKRTLEITRQKEFFQKVIDQIPALVFVRNKDGEYILLNKLCERLFDSSMEHLIGKTLRETHPYPNEIENAIEEDRDLLQNGTVYQLELKRKMLHGNEKWYYFSKCRMIVGDEPYVLGVYVDITTIKETQLRLQDANKELQETLDYLRSTQMRLMESEKMASLGVLTAGLAHEISNPINYVAGNVSPIRRDLQELIDLIKLKSKDWENAEDQKLLENLDVLYRELDHLLEGVSEGSSRVIGLINDLRSFSDHRPSDVMEQIDVNACINSTLNLIRFQPDKYVEFETNLNELPNLMGSSSKLKQVFLNLLTNSCQSIDKEGTVSVFSMEEKGQIIVIIRDSGSGIKDEYIGKIFEPFFTTKNIGQGTGLGLAISSDIIQEFGGEIVVDKTSAQGTSIKVILPLPPIV